MGSPPAIFYPTRSIETISNLASSPSVQLNYLFSGAKKIRTFWPKYRALEKSGPERTKCGLGRSSRYGSSRQKHCANSGMTVRSDRAENGLEKQAGGGRATAILHSPFLRRSALAYPLDPSLAGFLLASITVHARLARELSAMSLRKIASGTLMRRERHFATPVRRQTLCAPSPSFSAAAMSWPLGRLVQ